VTLPTKIFIAYSHFLGHVSVLKWRSEDKIFKFPTLTGMPSLYIWHCRLNSWRLVFKSISSLVLMTLAIQCVWLVIWCLWFNVITILVSRSWFWCVYHIRECDRSWVGGCDWWRVVKFDRLYLAYQCGTCWCWGPLQLWICCAHCMAMYRRPDRRFNIFLHQVVREPEKTGKTK